MRETSQVLSLPILPCHVTIALIDLSANLVGSPLEELERSSSTWLLWILMKEYNSCKLPTFKKLENLITSVCPLLRFCSNMKCSIHQPKNKIKRSHKTSLVPEGHFAKQHTKILRFIWSREHKLLNYNWGSVVWANGMSMTTYLQIKEGKGVLKVPWQVISITSRWRSTSFILHPLVCSNCP